jgi:hypothetical protein
MPGDSLFANPKKKIDHEWMKAVSAKVCLSLICFDVFNMIFIF